MSGRIRLVAWMLAVIAAGALSSSPPAANAAVTGRPALPRPALVARLTLPDGRHAKLYSDGEALVYSKDGRGVEIRRIPNHLMAGANGRPDTRRLTALLATKQRVAPYAPGWVIVVYRAGVTSPADVVSVDARTVVGLRAAAAAHRAPANVPSYTNDDALNRKLALLGADKSERLFAHFSRSALSAMQSMSPAQPGQRPLSLSNAFKVHVVGASVPAAVTALERDPGVAYASPDWYVAPMHVDSVPISAQQVAAAEAQARAMSFETPDEIEVAGQSRHAQIPDNFASKSSLQSMLNAPSDDVMAAFDEIGRTFHQMPGQGETITNVSVGDVDDSSNLDDPCYGLTQVFGPTTELVGGQHYLDMPSMPLIPAYTADANGDLSGSAEVCDVDPTNAEIGLDFSMMTPLPHERQRPGEQGSGFTDLLGIAPGASYRLVVPLDPNTTITDIDAAFLGAATQNPHPDVITASLGFGLDVYGFPARYLEEDQLTEALVASIVHQYREVVCIASGDGLRAFTTTAVGPSGGATATEVVGPGGTPTSLSDDSFSTIPSRVFDSGAIDAGGTTLDDISSAPPQDPRNADLASQHAFPETRWNGFGSFASGFGGRVDVSAPSDNVISFQHTFGGSFDAVDSVIQGGTSASAPEIAAAAAIALQVARLEGRPFSSPIDVRSFLEQNGVAVPSVSQADDDLHVGPQIDVRDEVEALIDRGGTAGTPSVARVAVEQRRGDLLGLDFNSVFLSYTDRSAIDLADFEGGFGGDANELAWITIAPDWEFVPRNARFRLFANGHPQTILAGTPWARLLPATILQAAGMTLASGQKRKVELTYEMLEGRRPVVTTTFTLGFGVAGQYVAGRVATIAPIVPPVASGSSIPVQYDLSGITDITSAAIQVSEVGRGDPSSIFSPPGYDSYTVSIQPGSKGTIHVPVSALHGGGMYGVMIVFNGPAGNGGVFNDVAAMRVVGPGESRLRPAAPLLAANGSVPGHDLEIPYGASFKLSYDVTNVPQATGAVLEISAAGPTLQGIWNPFNNPNGSARDADGIDTGSIYYQQLGGLSGTVALNAATVGLFPGMDHVVRVIPVSGGEAVGEAGDVSTITMDGVVPTDGGAIAGDFGIDRSGDDAFLTSNQTTASGEVLTSLETFDQKNAAISNVVESGSGSSFFTNGWGIFAGDIGLFGTLTRSPLNATYDLLDTVKTGTVGAAWTPPYPNSALNINETAADQEDDTGAFLLNLGAPYKFFTSDIVHDTFSKLIDIMGPVQGEGDPIYTGIAEDTRAGLAVIPSEDFSNGSCGTPTVLTTVDMKSGAVGSFQSTPNGSFPIGVAIDSATHRMVMPSSCFDLSIYDLRSKSGIDIPAETLGGAGYSAADSRNGRFLVYQQLPGDALINNNALAAVWVYDEQGNLLEQVERFSSPCFNWVPSNNLQINPATRTGFTPVGCGATQLAPFKY